MSTNSQDQEIDLGQVFQKIKDFFNFFLDSIFDFILFIKRNIIVLIILVAIGFGVGFFLDKNNKAYSHTILVTPNFGSSDYLYAKIDLLNAKNKEKDTLFLNSIGIKDIENFGKIEIEPIIDVYKFIANKPENFDLIKLMAEDGDLQKIIENDITSKNYPIHNIKFSTKGTTNYKKTVEPILAFLNTSEYYESIKKQNLQNIQEKIIANDSTIVQINSLLNEFASTSSNNQKNDKLVYYNENSQLNDIIETKEALVEEQGNNRINLINSDKIIKEISSTINIKNTEWIKNKMKIIIPFVLLFCFFLLIVFRNFYKDQIAKRNY
ncbi:hypothetical protein FIA58_007915 [Flavobacterium jejuense]|uniref:Polysaccharide chain length determinant N-terminal domain-containing protein n=1 Tax=Flavobacterium jejuense TaxID=1544455 RepID=A0ABX0IR98_9FLAO|nr:hypothetical protein [Flavobacterium jejuense]NHN25600.1 hypothetical protein [Flavobacterium jejuense]